MGLVLQRDLLGGLLVGVRLVGVHLGVLRRRAVDPGVAPGRVGLGGRF